MNHLTPRDSSPILLGGPIPPSYTTPSLTANLVCRVLFGLLANLACLVPLRLLYRNGELAAALFIVNVEVQNLRNVVNSLLWRNDDMASWWPGYGLCDVDAYLHNLGNGLYATCLLAIMRNLAIQVGSLRASPLSPKERQRRNIIQALVIFPLPLLQVAWTYPLTQQRYYIGTLYGCSSLNAPTWPYVVFEVLPPALVALVTAGYAVLIYIRFRQITKTTQSALSNNRLAHARNQRARRRLYLMVISILIPFLPIVVALAAVNIVVASPLQPFDLDAIHNGPREIPWSAIVYLPSGKISWAHMNICYIPIITAVPIFVFFGMTKDAMNCYRVILLYAGLGKVLPRLSSKKNTTSSALASNMRSGQAAPSALRQPPPSAVALPLHHQDVPIQLPHRNPFLFRTRLSFSLPFKLSLFKLPRDRVSSTPLEPLSHQPTHGSVWSDEESQLFVPSSAAMTASAAKQTSSNDGNDGNDGGEKNGPAIVTLPPVLLLDTTTQRAGGQREHLVVLPPSPHVPSL
ncbi:pheromone receptor [Trichoderma cornu-damae]|uniref:Pheromone receptor n=1 Tax=Trichoderma cornu-damae TaxID=654480 RepID=A0A9P8U036_9HYPO|nr:pheromone receptor [Trichoderma cornu-damae]